MTAKEQNKAAHAENAENAEECSVEETLAPLREKIAATAQAILDARALYPDSSLADLYDPLTMPPELRKAQVRRFCLAIELDASVSNNVEVAFGRDMDEDGERIAVDSSTRMKFMVKSSA